MAKLTERERALARHFTLKLRQAAQQVRKTRSVGDAVADEADSLALKYQGTELGKVDAKLLTQLQGALAEYVSEVSGDEAGESDTAEAAEEAAESEAVEVETAAAAVGFGGASYGGRTAGGTPVGGRLS